MVPRMKRAGSDLVVVPCHPGATPGSSYGDALPYPENASTQLAEEVADSVPEDEDVATLLRPQHETVVGYVNSVIGTSRAAMSAQTSRYEDTAAMDLVATVQGAAVKAALAGTADADTPVLAIVAPFNRDAGIPAGDVTVRDVAGLYIYDNTLLGITLTGARARDYLEYSARYFEQVSGTGPYAPDDVTDAARHTAPNGTPDDNYDIVTGLEPRSRTTSTSPVRSGSG